MLTQARGLKRGRFGLVLGPRLVPLGPPRTQQRTHAVKCRLHAEGCGCCRLGRNSRAHAASPTAHHFALIAHHSLFAADCSPLIVHHMLQWMRSAEWGPQEDSMLMLGAWRHGNNAWDK